MDIFNLVSNSGHQALRSTTTFEKKISQPQTTKKCDEKQTRLSLHPASPAAKIFKRLTALPGASIDDIVIDLNFPIRVIEKLCLLLLPLVTISNSDITMSRVDWDSVARIMSCDRFECEEMWGVISHPASTVPENERLPSLAQLLTQNNNGDSPTTSQQHQQHQHQQHQQPQQCQ
eukprot:c12582_g5_i1.p1 GENE.c12582_g5_i1~~c12582_g5_i1.p1  ORF type:complete len:175 (+),score=35.63 c12582_g5_i1:130-654(+)